MPRPLWYPSLLALASLVLASCGGNDTPTAPSTGVEGAGAALATAVTGWTERAPLPSSRVSLAAAVVNNSAGQPILYAIGGDDGDGVSLATLVVYDFASNSWSTRGSLPARLEETNGAGVIDGKIYVSGGRDLDNSSPGSDDGAPRSTLYVYDPAANSWTRKADMPEPSIAGVSGVIGGKLYVLNTESTRFFRYDPPTNSWSTLPHCPTQHFRGSGAVIGGKLYVAGGEIFSVNGPYAVKRVHVYDPISNSWTVRAPLIYPVFASAAARLQGQLYVLGGNRGDRSHNFVQAYDPVANAWSLKASLPTRRSSLAAANVVLGGQQRIVAVGGFGGTGDRALRSNDLFTP